MTRRMYKSGSRWSLWRWTDVVLNGVLYLRRLHLVQTPWFSVMLHWLTPDPQPDLHDHPVSFLSIPLRGGYCEMTPSGGRLIGMGYHATNFKRATDTHRISWVHPDGALTLVFAGPVVRSWGFHTPRGWVPWREYQHNGDAQ
jgi:hypothetical protein